MTAACRAAVSMIFDVSIILTQINESVGIQRWCGAAETPALTFRRMEWSDFDIEPSNSTEEFVDVGGRPFGLHVLIDENGIAVRVDRHETSRSAGVLVGLRG